MNNRRLLEIAEYASLCSSVVGSVVAVVSGQLIYACAPLSLSIGLNLVNRYRFEQLLQYRQQQLSQKLQALVWQVATLPSPVDISGVEAAIAAIQADISSHLAPKEQLDLKSIEANIAQLQDQYASLQQSLTTVNHHLELFEKSSLPNENLLEIDRDDEDIDALLDALD